MRRSWTRGSSPRVTGGLWIDLIETRSNRQAPSNGPDTRTFSMNLRLRSSLSRKQKIEIATLVGLPDMGRIHRPVSALVMRRRRAPGAAAAREFFVGDVEMDAPRIGVDLDLIAGLHESKRPAHVAFRRHMQDAGAVAGAAHAAVREAQHVAHARLHKLPGNRQHPPFGHAGSALGTGILEHDDVVRGDVKIVAID